MKKFFSLSFSLAVILVLAFVIAGCGGSGSSTTNPYAGTWYGKAMIDMEKSTYWPSVTLTVDNNGNCTGTVEGQTATGTCDKEGNVSVNTTATLRGTPYNVTMTGTFQASLGKIYALNVNSTITGLGSFPTKVILWAPSYFLPTVWAGPYSITSSGVEVDKGQLELTLSNDCDINVKITSDSSATVEFTRFCGPSTDAAGGAKFSIVTTDDPTETFTFKGKDTTLIGTYLDISGENLVMTDGKIAGGIDGILSATLSKK